MYNTIQAANIEINGDDIELTFPHNAAAQYDFIFRNKRNFSALEQAAAFVISESSCVKMDLLPKPPPSKAFQDAVDLVVEVFDAEPLTTPLG